MVVVIEDGGCGLCCSDSSRKSLGACEILKSSAHLVDLTRVRQYFESLSNLVCGQWVVVVNNGGGINNS